MTDSARMRGARALAAFILIAASPWLGAAFAQTTPTPTPTISAAPSPTPTPTPTVLATPSPTPGPTATPTPTPALGPSDSSPTGLAVELTAHPSAYVEGKANRDEVYAAIMGSIAAVRAEVNKAGLKPLGNPLSVFLEADDDGFKYRAEVPLESAPDGKTQLSDSVKLGLTPVGKAMKFEHRGAYDDIDATYEAITAYLDEKGVDAQDVFIEEYLNEPKTGDDPNLQVDIFVLTK